jgi:hypothetical protein
MKSQRGRTDGTLLREYTLTGSGAAEYWNTWEHEKDYIHGPEGALASVSRTGTQHFLHKDHLGTLSNRGAQSEAAGGMG